MNYNDKRIQEIDSQIARLEEEKAKLVAENKIPETQRKVREYLERTYSGKKLAEKHPNLDVRAVWQVKGEDPNCDLGGSHIQPDLGLFEGSLKEALEWAVNHPNFYTWGGGGDIYEAKIINK